MNKAPKVLTRMRLSCCWGDNLNEKELNEVVDYIGDLEQQVKKQQEVIDKAIEYIENNQEEHKYTDRGGFTYTQGYFLTDSQDVLDILNKVSE